MDCGLITSYYTMLRNILPEWKTLAIYLTDAIDFGVSM